MRTVYTIDLRGGVTSCSSHARLLPHALIGRLEAQL